MESALSLLIDLLGEEVIGRRGRTGSESSKRRRRSLLDRLARLLRHSKLSQEAAGNKFLYSRLFGSCPTTTEALREREIEQGELFGWPDENEPEVAADEG